MTMLQIALACIQRGWHVFPCWPKTKNPMTPHGFKDATNLETHIREWWGRTPEANVAIATGPSGLTVLDRDHGCATEDEAWAWMTLLGLPKTYTVHTGRRWDPDDPDKKPEYGVQMYYSGEQVKSIAWVDGDFSGDIRSATGYVMAAGSVHDVSGERYEVLVDAPVVEVPRYVQEMKAASREGAPGRTGLGAWFDPGGKITHGRHESMLRLLGKKRGEGYDDDAIELYALETNLERFDPPIEDLDRLIADVCRYAVGELDPGVSLGRVTVKDGVAVTAPEPVVDWRSHYHTFEAMNDAPEPVFLIQDFLQYESITAIAAPVGQRKSILALNVADALCSGRPLFDKFAVVTPPSRVLYLCPEMGIRSFADRTRKVGLMPFVGKTLFVRTMSPVNPDNELQEELTLDELQPEEVDGAVVIIDTAVRFIQGDENSSEHMRVFARSIFRLTKLHAAAVVVLFHSGKGTKEAPELTLENAMRGSGELGAFVTCCWATRLQDPEHPYTSKSYLANVKPRDFDAKPFEVIGSRNQDGSELNDCRMHFVDNGDAPVVLTKKQGGVKADADGLDAAAHAFIKENVTMTVPALVTALAGMGIDRKKTWVTKARLEARGAGTTLQGE